MRINIISIGKLKDQYQAIADHYRKMIKTKLSEYEITYHNKPPINSIKQFEMELIKKKIPLHSQAIILDAQGRSITSHKFSELIHLAQIHSKIISFIIGGPYGLHESFKSEENNILKLSDFTLPHQMAKLMLIEQIYRAESIIASTAYHK